MKQHIDHNILQKFVSGKYSLKEFLLIRHWFENKNNETELKIAIQQHWEQFANEDTEHNKDLSSVFNEIKQKIADETPQNKLRIKIKKYYFRAAAVLLIPLLLYSTYSAFFKAAPKLYSSVEIVSPLGARTNFELPDGTKGCLNSGSTLSYETGFLHERSVHLTGEAWFDVTHQDNNPFNVYTKHLQIEDLGTQFSVAAYSEDETTDVVLQQGKVKVHGLDKLFEYAMKPDEKYSYIIDKQKGNIQKVNAEQLSAWKDGLLIFRSEPLSDVLKRIGRWYNVDIVLNDPYLEKMKYRATFQEEQLEEVIRLISLTVPIEYSFNRRKMSTDGVFNKREITIVRKRQ